MSTSASTATTTTSSATTPAATAAVRSPSQTTFNNLFKKALADDKPVLFDYWVGSLEKKVAIGVQNEGKTKILVRSEEEYTSPIVNIFKSETEFIIITENSIYVVDAAIPVKKIA